MGMFKFECIHIIILSIDWLSHMSIFNSY